LLALFFVPNLKNYLQNFFIPKVIFNIVENFKTRTMKNKEALLSYWDNFNTELYYKYLKARQK
jgi:hypothetical protein